MAVKTSNIHLSTRGNVDIHNVTEQVERAISESGLKYGSVTIFTPSSTSAFTTIEYESGALNDLRRLFEEIIPSNREYAHNARWGDDNGYAHLRSALVGAARSFPLAEGHILIGTWQQIVLCDFDSRPRDRQVVVTVVGD